MKKLQFGKDALMLAILTLITVLTWVVFDIYRTLTKTDIPRVLQKQIAPLNPKISLQTLEGLQQRNSFTQEELNEVTVLPLEEELVEETATEGGIVATESGILEE